MISNSPIKRYRLIEWINKQDSTICCFQELHLTGGDSYRLKVKGWKLIQHANGAPNQTGVATLISDKADFTPKFIRRDKEGRSYSKREQSNKKI